MEGREYPFFFFKLLAASDVLLIITFTLLSQLKDMAERLPPGAYETDNIKLAYPPNGLEPNGIHYPNTNGDRHSRSNSTNNSFLASPTGPDSASSNGTHGSTESLRGAPRTNETTLHNQAQGLVNSNGRNEYPDATLTNGSGGVKVASSSVLEASEKEPGLVQEGENGTKSNNLVGPGNGNQVEAEWIEQYEPGVYITLMALRDGTRDLKRVRFR